MANKWVYRNQSIYWQANHRAFTQHKWIDQSTTTDITGILATPRRLDKAQEQWWGITARRRRHESFTYQHRPDIGDLGAQLYLQSLSGQFGITQNLAVNQVTGATGANGTGTVTSPSITTVSGSTLLVVVCAYNVSTSDGADGDITDSKSNTYKFRAKNMAGGFGCNVAVYEQVGGTRGSGHTITANFLIGTGTLNIHVVEVTGADPTAAYDSTTLGTASDAASPLSVTAGGAISGDQIALWAGCIDNGVDATWTPPTGYTNVYNEGHGSVSFVSGVFYKINETGTPTVDASYGGSISTARELFVTFKEAASSPGIIGDLTPVYIPAPADVITPRAFEQYQRILTPRRHAAFAFQQRRYTIQATGATYDCYVSGIFV